MTKWFLSALIICCSLQAQAFEDYIVTTNGKLTDISIEDNTIVDVYPLITLMNDKNTLMVTPLKSGQTRVCVLKNNKEIVMFNIEVTTDKTTINPVKGFEIFALDVPQTDKFELDNRQYLKGESDNG